MRYFCVFLTAAIIFFASEDVSAQKSRSSSSSSSSSSRSYGQSSSSSKSYGTPSSSKAPSSSGKSYGHSPSSGSPSKVGQKPSSGSFNKVAADTHRHEESRQAYRKSNTTSYVDSAGKTREVDIRDKRVERLQSHMTHDSYVNREVRVYNFYQGYYNRPVVIYNDPYGTFFWWWLLDRSIEQQAMWAYCHRHDMDAARYQALLEKDARLAARVAELERKNVPRDASYVPEGMAEPDLMYSKEYVEAVYKPSGGGALKILLIVFLVLAILSVLAWLIFMKRW